MLKYNVTLDGKTVLVTGVAGFIGSYLAKRLFKDFKEMSVEEVSLQVNKYFAKCADKERR